MWGVRFYVRGGEEKTTSYAKKEEDVLASVNDFPLFLSV